MASVWENVPSDKPLRLKWTGFEFPPDVSVDSEVVQPPSPKAKSSVPKSPQVNALTTPTTLRAQRRELDELFPDGVITQEQRDAAKNGPLGI